MSVSLQAGLNVVINTGDTTILLSDALRRSLMEIELGRINAGMARLPISVLQAHLHVQISIWSYNSVIESWEPVMEPWGLLTKLELNRMSEVCSFSWIVLEHMQTLTQHDLINQLTFCHD